MRMTKIFWKKFKSPIALGTGMLIGTSMAMAAVFATNYDPKLVKKPRTVIESVDPNQAEIAFLADPVLERLREMRITSYYQYGENISYGLERRVDPVTEDEVNYQPREVFQSSQLEDMGYDVQPASKCAFSVMRANQAVEVYCF